MSAAEVDNNLMVCPPPLPTPLRHCRSLDDKPVREAGRRIRLPDEVLHALIRPWETGYGRSLAEKMAAQRNSLFLRTDALSALTGRMPLNLIERNLEWRRLVREFFTATFTEVMLYPDFPQVVDALKSLCRRIRVWRRIMGEKTAWDVRAVRGFLDWVRAPGGAPVELIGSAAQRMFAYTGSLFQIRNIRGLDRRYRRAFTRVGYPGVCPGFVREVWAATSWPGRASRALAQDLADCALEASTELVSTPVWTVPARVTKAEGASRSRAEACSGVSRPVNPAG